MEKRRVILVTDGDEYAKKTIQYVAKFYGGRCISSSFGNPTKLSGEEIVQLIHQAPYDPVFVMFDDSGFLGEGFGEKAMKYVAKDPSIEVLGVIAVASKTHDSEWAKVDITVDRFGEVSPYGVDKSGIQEMDIGRINGDTIYCLDELNVPIIVGVGDIGKMARIDDVKNGAPVTKKAVEIILERSGYDVSKWNKHEADITDTF